MLVFESSGYGYSKILCKDIVYWFVSNYLQNENLEIEVNHHGLKKEKVFGYCDILGETDNPKEFLIELDTHMNKKTYATVLLHELYHVLQWMRGELKVKSCKMYYKNECVEDLEYLEQGHEIAARWNENILYQKYLRYKGLTHL